MNTNNENKSILCSQETRNTLQNVYVNVDSFD